MTVNLNRMPRDNRITKEDGRLIQVWERYIQGIERLSEEKLTGAQGVAVADSSGAVSIAEIETKFNELLASLRTAGIIGT